MDPALLRNIALETNDQGASDARLALAARRLVDRNGQVVINPDDLSAIPMWRKYRVRLSDFFNNPEAQLNNNKHLSIPLIGNALDLFIYDAAMRAVQPFAGPGTAPVDNNFFVTVGYGVPTIQFDTGTGLVFTFEGGAVAGTVPLADFGTALDYWQLNIYYAGTAGDGIGDPNTERAVFQQVADGSGAGTARYYRDATTGIWTYDETFSSLPDPEFVIPDGFTFRTLDANSGEDEASVMTSVQNLGDPRAAEDRALMTFSSQNTYINLYPTGGSAPRISQIRIYLVLQDATGIESYEALTGGIVDVWLLVAKLPA
jgi:hypothetical protein